MATCSVPLSPEADAMLQQLERDRFFAELKRTGTPVAWKPQPGSQTLFLLCPVFEICYEGTRGPGKTAALLIKFVMHVGRGWGEKWRGIIFRKTYPELADVIAKSKEIFPKLWPGAKYNEAKTEWRFPDGEVLRFRQFAKVDDYWKYHGHEYPFIAWEEMTTWPDDKCFRRMMSCSRSTAPGMPRFYGGTTNPYGVGHNWVKRRYQLPTMRGKVIREYDPDSKTWLERVAINGNLRENKILLKAEPTYISKLKAAARNPSELKAWLEGSWDIIAGGMFDDIWDPKYHIIRKFPLQFIPKGWYIDRAFDWGSSKPFSTGWFARSNGEPLNIGGKTIGTVRGDLFHIAEWYGWNGTDNEGVHMLAKDIADGIKDREEDWGIKGRVRAGPADRSIFDEENGMNIARDMELRGVRWEKADKSSGSRKQGWQQIRQLLKQALPNPDGTPRELPGLFVMETCEQWLRTVPVLPRLDKDLDDVDSDAEDHCGDMTRYRCRMEIKVVRRGKF